MDEIVKEIVIRIEKRLDRIEEEIVELQKNFWFQKGKIWALVAVVSAGISVAVQVLLSKFLG